MQYVKRESIPNTLAAKDVWILMNESGVAVSLAFRG